MYALEPRIMYDAAAVLGFADAVDHGKPEVPPGQNKDEAPGNSGSNDNNPSGTGGNQGNDKNNGNAGGKPEEPPVVEPEQEEPQPEVPPGHDNDTPGHDNENPGHPENPSPPPVVEPPAPPVIEEPVIEEPLVIEPAPPVVEEPVVEEQTPVEPPPFEETEFATIEEYNEFYNIYTASYYGYSGRSYAFDYDTGYGNQYITETLDESYESLVKSFSRGGVDFSGLTGMTPEQMLLAGVDPTMIFDATASGVDFTDQLEAEGYEFTEEQRTIFGLLENTVGLLNCK